MVIDWECMLAPSAQRPRIIPADESTEMAASLLPQADRFFDERTDDPHWNESVWFSISKPEERLHGLIQYYFRPNMGMLNGGPVLWDPSGTRQWNCLYYNWAHLQASPAGAAKFDMTAYNSLSVKVLEPLTAYAIRYNKDGLEIDCVWQAIGPVHELRTGEVSQEKAAKFHIEQPGRMTGTVRLDGREIAINCLSMRDTSYGPRNYESLATGGYFWGIAPASAFHAIAKGETEQRVIGGFIWKEGELSSLASGTRRILEFGRYGPKRVLLEAKDKLGRTIDATGEMDEGLIFTGYTDHTVYWSLMRWDWDGVEHWGDNQEFCSAVRFRRIARGELTLGG
jgi:hypothetical protein